eukprot:NODE_970_length_1196_cov_59.969486_g732_i0.p1 GENE.NODE_970_length_1196_cov_59.969486_g732_i0~~NODE_970_length_1196_cov_59.969486_g732_i0.p1  ORF type:complete len:276 (-),score=46.58 NODE_970_length_1196_cov_59.969486_g732_i0:279-1106(-)
MPLGDTFCCSDENMHHVGDFEDLKQPLALNRSASFVFDIPTAHLNKNISFITLQDVGCSPRDRARTVKPIQQLCDLPVDREDWVLSQEHLNLTSYECMLLSNDMTYLRLLNRLSRDGMMNMLSKDQHDFEAIRTMQKRLGISDAKHSLMVQKLNATVARAPPNVPANSCHLQFLLLHSLLYERQAAATAAEARDMYGPPDEDESSLLRDSVSLEQDGPEMIEQDLENLDLANQEFRHLALLANCIGNAVHFLPPGSGDRCDGNVAGSVGFGLIQF